MKTKHDPKIWLMTTMLGILGILVIAIAFFVLKPVFQRFSLDFYYPVLKIVRSTEGVIAEKSLLAEDKSTLAKAVTLLQEQNARLAAENAALSEVREENRQLREMQRLQAPAGYGIIHSEILTRDPATWQESFVIDHGSDSGIRVGDLVVSQSCTGVDESWSMVAVGRVTEVSTHTATVGTLYSEKCFLGGYLQETLVYGMLSGANRHGVKLLKISHLPPDKKYRAGEPVLTSRDSRNFPGGVLIGRIAANPDGSPSVRLDHHGLSAEGMVEPAINLSSLRFVTVLTEKK